MKRTVKAVSSGIVALFLISLLAIVSNAEERETIYRVTATSLIVRQDAAVKSTALFSLPRGAYVLNDSGSMMQSQAIETIANRKGRWIRVCGFNGNRIGYVFEGFLEKAQDVKSRPIGPECTFKANSVECGGEVFTYTDKTPIAGAWFENPETYEGNISYVYENSPRLLKRIIKDTSPETSPGGDVVMIVKGNVVMQFISTPPPRGY